MPDVPYDIGTIFRAASLEEHVRDRLKTWMGWYLARVDEADQIDGGRGPGKARAATGVPSVYVSQDEETLRLEEVAPALVVLPIGQDGDLTEHGAKAGARTWWRLDLLVVGGGATEEGTRALTDRLATATRLILRQKLRGGPCERSALRPGEAPYVLGRGDNRRLYAIRQPFALLIPSVVDGRARPPRTVPGDPGDHPTFRTPDAVRVTTTATT